MRMADAEMINGCPTDEKCLCKSTQLVKSTAEALMVIYTNTSEHILILLGKIFYCKVHFLFFF